MLNRRSLFFGASSLLAAPAIVRAQTILVPLVYKPLTYDSASIQVAIDQAGLGGGGIVRLPAGIFNITSGLVGRDNVTVIGSGGRATELRYANALDGQHLFNAFGCNGFRVQDCWINVGDYLGPTDGGSVVRFGYDRNLQKGGFGCEFRHNVITGLRRYGVFADGETRHLIVDDNYIEASAPMNGGDTGGISNTGIIIRPHVPDPSAPGGLRSLMHVTAKINHNTTVNLCGIMVSLWKSEIMGNNCRASGYGANIVTEGDIYCRECRIIGNEGSSGVVIGTVVAGEGFELWGTGHEVAGNIGIGNASDGMVVCGDDIRVHSNTMAGNYGAGFSGHPIQAPNSCTFFGNSTFGNLGGATRFPVPVIAPVGANDFR